MKGKQLNTILKIGANHALYREDGKWYHNLTDFPGALFDKNGFLFFDRISDYLGHPHLQIGKDLHIKNGISSISGYKAFTKGQRTKIIYLISLGNNKASNHRIKVNESAFSNKEMQDFSFVQGRPDDLIEIRRNKTPEVDSKEIRTLHRQISKGLYEFLLLNFGEKNLSCDCPTLHGTFIDMARKSRNSYIFYEIKTYMDLRKSIREAFGQLMEYSYWNCKGLANQIVIVTNQPPDQDVKNYFKFLRKKFRIPIYYQQFDLKKRILSNKF